MTVGSAGSRRPASSADRSSEFLRAHAVRAAAIAAAGSAAMIIGAYFFQHVLKIPPCPLCLEQRIPHYLAAPLALIVAVLAEKGAPRMLVAAGFAALVLALLTTASIGVYHSGVEWRWWPGPADCTGEIANFGTAGGNLLKQMQTAVVVRCDDVQWRFAGLSLAGYNALFSFALAVIAGWGLVRTVKRPQ
ncbi:MAG: disulfide bond formation protein B [Rhodoplanes sp.]